MRSHDASPAVVDDYVLPGHLELPTSPPPAQLAPTIYPSEEGVIEQGASGRQGQGPHMLSTAVRIQLDPQRNVKVLHVCWLLGVGGGSCAPSVQGGDCHCPDCPPTPTLPPGVSGDSATSQSHPAPLHGSA